MLALWLTACVSISSVSESESSSTSVTVTVPGGGTTDHPAVGTLSITQLRLGGWSTGEAVLIVGPAGDKVLIDLGNDSHDDDVVEALEAAGGRSVEHVLLTHFHEDHVGGFDNLFEDDRVTIKGDVVYRGPYDLDESDANPASWEEVCELTADRTVVALCSGDQPAPCDIEQGGGPWPASTCGDWESDLGGGATLRVVAVNGWAGGRQMTLPDDDENSRSLVAHLSFGDFDAVFGGDLTGGGKDTPDVESHVVDHADLPAEGVDVLQLNHHGIDSSNHTPWLDALLPDDGHDRQVLVGANSLYLSAPDQDVLDRIGTRVGGGAVWAPETGSLAGNHPRLCVGDGPITVTVTDGARYTVSADDPDGTCPETTFTAVP